MQPQAAIIPAIALASLISTARAEEITFGPVVSQAGQSVRLLTHTETQGGTIARTVAGRTTNGTIAISRDRDLVWTFRPPTADGTKRGMVKVNSMVSQTKTSFDGQDDNAADPSPLNGKMFAMSKSPVGDWKFELDGSLPLTRIHNEIDELTVYLKRDWYPTKPVKLGDSWEFDPAWVKMIVERDLKNAQTIGTMRLRQIRHTVDREFAVIDVTIRSTGGDFRPDGIASEAAVELTGQMTINLKTMLDENLELKGKVVSTTSTATESSRVTLPLTLTVTKSFVSSP